jgi:hypothetical protein
VGVSLWHRLVSSLQPDEDFVILYKLFEDMITLLIYLTALSLSSCLIALGREFACVICAPTNVTVAEKS